MPTETTNKIAVYPGTFDPITYGHIDVIKRSQKLFEKVIVAVLENSRKSCLFSTAERIDMIKNSVADIEVESFSGLLVDFLKRKNAFFVIRGLRAVSDFDYEFQMAIANKSLVPEIETIFIMTDKEHFYLNSTLVKELAKNRADLKDLVPEPVERALQEKFK
ncbi:MAG: pantetheine-phosphate adenylyltransferase [Candidatus Aenigmarchaeota archaeon]|nr:pantetheine-phosphate adenylyltransferase [Candidatus Aenigmarchaeota archaeon]